jgi:hypothetical protein
MLVLAELDSGFRRNDDQEKTLIAIVTMKRKRRPKAAVSAPTLPSDR